MTDLIQLVYASRATFSGSKEGVLVEPEVARILTQSRRNNRPQRIGGVLVFADGCFFQCLEGDAAVVEPLYEHLHGDPRHDDVKLLLKRPVDRRLFRLWAMKYITVDKAVRSVLKRAGVESFDPYQFDEKTIDDLLIVLREATHQAPIEGDREPPPIPTRGSTLDWPSFGIGVAFASLVCAGVIAFGLLPGG